MLVQPALPDHPTDLPGQASGSTGSICCMPPLRRSGLALRLHAASGYPACGGRRTAERDSILGIRGSTRTPTTPAPIRVAEIDDRFGQVGDVVDVEGVAHDHRRSG